MFTCICPDCGKEHHIPEEDFGVLSICECGCGFDSAENVRTPQQLLEQILNT